jgi:long-chain acyl-CoA synthetase
MMGTIVDVIDWQSKQNAIENQDGSLVYSYLELAHVSDQVCQSLKSCDVQSGEPVVTIISNTPIDLVNFIGIWKVGAVAVPVHRSSLERNIQDIVDRTSARIVIVGQDTDHFPGLDALVVESDAVRLLVFNRDIPSRDKSLQDAALIVFTSGSTGKSKGVVLTNSVFVNKLRAIDYTLQFDRGIRSLVVLHMNFAFAQWVSLITLMKGGTVVINGKFAVESCLNSLIHTRIDLVAMVPTMLRAILAFFAGDIGKEVQRMLASTESPLLICSGGEPLSATIGRQFRELLPNVSMADVYGLTETCTSDFILPPDRFDAYPGSIGFPGYGVTFRITDPDGGKEAPTGSVGLLEIKTPYLMTGYYDAPELTRASMNGEFFRTGDLAWVGTDGAVFLSGRFNDLILRGGNKISPLEIDDVLQIHPAVDACLTTGLASDLMGQEIHTLVVSNDEDIGEIELKTWLVGKLEKYKIPDRFYFGDSIPQGQTGKADRRALAAYLMTQIESRDDKA